MIKQILTIILVSYIPVMVVMMGGCDEQQTYTARITGVDEMLHHSGTERTVVYDKPLSKSKIVSKAKHVKKPYKKTVAKTKVKYGWIPPSSVERDWSAIVIHHSATQKGSMASIDRYHRDHNGWDGVGYDFVIGNGSQSTNGKIEPTFRWRQQRTGAHCKTNYGNWANRSAIGVCLVGNFEQVKPKYAQMGSLVELVRFLSSRYDIPITRIYGHKDTPGHSTSTVCPGRKFPMTYLKASI